MLRDDGPPVSLETIKEARGSLRVGYGHKVVEEQGRRVLLVRCPREKPDYVREVEEAALFVPLDDVRDVKDVILIGHEKSCRVEPVALRDQIREHHAKGATLVEDVRRRLHRDYGVTTRPTPHGHDGTVVLVRIPQRTVEEFTPQDVLHIRSAVKDTPSASHAHVAYVIADNDHERLDAVSFAELTGVPLPEAPAGGEAPAVDGLKAAALAASDPDVHAAPEAAPAPEPEPATPRPTPAEAPRPAPAPEPAPAAPPEVAEADAGEAPDGQRGMRAVQMDDEIEVYVRETPRDGQPVARAPSAPPAPEPVEAAPAPEPEPVPEPEAPATPERTLPTGPEDAPGYSDGPVPGRVMEVLEENDEYEVFVTKKTPSVDLPESPTAATNAVPEPAPEPAQAEVAPESEPEAAPAPREAPPVRDTPETWHAPGSASTTRDRDVPHPRNVAGPSGDVGEVVEPTIESTVDPVDALSGKLQADEYEVMSDVEVMGHTFDLAAHRMEGKRILVKRYERLDHARLEEMTRVADELGADVCLLVASVTAPGVRLAAWGSRVVVLSPEEAARLNP